MGYVAACSQTAAVGTLFRTRMRESLRVQITALPGPAVALHLQAPMMSGTQDTSETAHGASAATCAGYELLPLVLPQMWRLKSESKCNPSSCVTAKARCVFSILAR